MKAIACAQPVRVLSLAARLMPYNRTARGRPASRRILSPSGCLPRVTIRRLTVDGMGDNHDDTAPRLSGMWVGLPEAFAWITTREAPTAAEHAQSSPFRLSFGMAFYAPADTQVAMGAVDAGKASLLVALKHGKVLARGRPGNLFGPLEARAEIGPDQWAFLRFGEIDQKFRAQAQDGQTPEFWHDVIVRADQLMTAFPPPILAKYEDRGGSTPLGRSTQPAGAQNEKEHHLAGETAPIEAPSRSGPIPYAERDRPAVERMRKLIQDEGVATPSKAADIIVAEGKVVGDGKDESKAKRLQRLYKATFGSD
jgi:hypothetical protein